jgi:accessory gene regulator protein AgrB
LVATIASAIPVVNFGIAVVGILFTTATLVTIGLDKVTRRYRGWLRHKPFSKD